jgi:DNA-binding transcriptional LysR family regulator
MIPSASDLQYFIEVTQTLNLSRAAERLGIRQPSLSLALQRLEDSIGCTLLIRTKKGVQLTDEGHVFLGQAQQLLALWQDLRQKTNNHQQEVKGILRLGCHVSVALYSLPFLLKDFLALHKNIEFNLEHDLSRKITEAIISMRLDLGIVVNPVRHPDLVIIKLCEDDVCFWQQEKINKDLQSLLIYDSNLIQSQELLRKSSTLNYRFNRFVKTTSLELARELASQGAGVAILPTRVASSSKLKRIKNLPCFKDEICLVYRHERKTSKSIQALSEQLKKTLKNTEA